MKFYGRISHDVREKYNCSHTEKQQNTLFKKIKVILEEKG